MLYERASGNGLVAFAIVYLTFFLDNVLLTVLVPIIPDWVRGESLALWATHDAPLMKLLNTTVNQITNADEYEGVGGSQAVVGAVLGAKAAAQLLTAPMAANAVSRRGPAPVLRAGTILLAIAATVFAWCARSSTGVVGAGLGRIIHGTGSALAGVAGLALAAALPPPRRDRAVAVLLGAVALGVLVGYPFGGSAYSLWSSAAPFQLVFLALLLNLGLQYFFLCEDSYQIQLNQENNNDNVNYAKSESIWRVARRGAAAECAGAVLFTTSIMAALEPCLPLWMLKKFHPKRWQTGAAFLPDSLGYLIATSSLGGVTKCVGAERVALVGQVSVGLAALAVPYARTAWGLALPQLWLGAGLGATDVALAPALLARRPRRLPQLAALLQAAASAAYALGPVVGGVLSWAVGFETALRTLGVANLLYAGLLYRALVAHPLSAQKEAAHLLFDFLCRLLRRPREDRGQWFSYQRLHNINRCVVTPCPPVTHSSSGMGISKERRQGHSVATVLVMPHVMLLIMPIALCFWGAGTPTDDDSDVDGAELTPLR